MSNKVRRCEPNLTYHTYSRCDGEFYLMKRDKMKELMLKVITMAQKKYKFDLISYVILDNNFDFLIRTIQGGASISRIMQFIKAQYALRYNKMMNRIGPFWNERYTDMIIEENAYPVEEFIKVTKDITNKPVKSGYVNNAKNYKYSSIRFYIDEKYTPPVKLTFHEYYMTLGSSFSERAERFLGL
jgi:REP element-mobilizing transposase RayT